MNISDENNDKIGQILFWPFKLISTINCILFKNLSINKNRVNYGLAKAERILEICVMMKFLRINKAF